MILFHNVALISILMYVALFLVLWYFRKGVCFKMIPKNFVGGTFMYLALTLISTGMDYTVNGPESVKHIHVNIFCTVVYVVLVALHWLSSVRDKIKGDI